MFRSLAICVPLCITIVVATAQAVVIDGRTYSTGAFASRLVSASGSFTWLEDGPEPEWVSHPLFTLPGSPADYAALQTAVVGSNLDTAGELHEDTTATLAFGVMWPVNGPGADIAIYEVGRPEPFTLTLNGTTRVYMPVDQAFTSPHGGLAVNAAFIDLTDFGYLAGQTTETLALGTTVTGDGWDDPDIAVVAAINTVIAPEPASASLLMVIAAGVLLSRKDRWHSSQNHR